MVQVSRAGDAKRASPACAQGPTPSPFRCLEGPTQKRRRSDHDPTRRHTQTRRTRTAMFWHTLGWCQGGGQWGGIYSSPMECSVEPRACPDSRIPLGRLRSHVFSFDPPHHRTQLPGSPEKKKTSNTWFSPSKCRLLMNLDE